MHILWPLNIYHGKILPRVKKGACNTENVWKLIFSQLTHFAFHRLCEALSKQLKAKWEYYFIVNVWVFNENAFTGNLQNKLKLKFLRSGKITTLNTVKKKKKKSREQVSVLLPSLKNVISFPTTVKSKSERQFVSKANIK